MVKHKSADILAA